MADDRRNGEPTELIYLPEPSWSPVLLALGLGGVLAGLWTWWPYGVIGGVVALAALWLWIREARDAFNRLPRRQRVATAVIPAVPLRRDRSV
jgi:hypothetical protein